MIFNKKELEDFIKTCEYKFDKCPLPMDNITTKDLVEYMYAFSVYIKNNGYEFYRSRSKQDFKDFETEKNEQENGLERLSRVSSNLQSWLLDYKFLPDFLKDGDLQGDFFTAFHYDEKRLNNTLSLSRWYGNILLVDRILFYMARVGWVIRKNPRKKSISQNFISNTYKKTQECKTMVLNSIIESE